jgi:alkylation response protein AidB-like acyl-CoA dehydrogenase
MRRVAEGVIFGNATTEAGDGALATMQTSLFQRERRRVAADGDKFYSTGTLYADWVAVGAAREHDPAAMAHPWPWCAPTPQGVTRVDDWNGFGQRLTASGTTRFARVPVDEAHIVRLTRGTGATLMTAHFQLFHIATLAGIARAIVRDAVAFVQPRKRVFSHGSGAVPREDPLVQQVIGQLASTAFVATLAVREVARGLGQLDQLSTARRAAS